ncbi:MAG: TIM barrel protein [Desulfobacterales bacterium]|nr:TIM barrel protein [Desulfobacterales bacterium]
MSETGRIRIGNQTAFSALTAIQPFEYAVANGFDAFEWFPDKKESGAGWTESDLSKETRVLIKNTALAHDMRLSVHADLPSSPLRPEFCDLLYRDIELAQDIGASVLNIHLDTDEGIDAYVEAIMPCIRRLARAGIKLAIENTPVTGPEDFNELFRRLHNLGSTDAAHVGMCLDLGHANLCEPTRNDYLKFIDLLDPQVPIIHVHIHENYGDYDSHLPLFTGPAAKDPSGIKGFMVRIRKRGFSGCVIFEQWPQPPCLLNEARNRLFDIIGKSLGHMGRISCPPKSPLPPFRKGNLEVPAPPFFEAGGILPQMDDFADTIAEADRRCRSWREKLGWVHARLTDDTFDLTMEQLIYLALYLRFIGTGQVACSEDGRHYRPCHHAGMAGRMQDRLSKMTTPYNVFIIRKIYPWLPSCDSAFTRAEPLTRIRDIAHRNDIPRELKQESKHTLQNKLHRCAGPEDLAASAALLKRITAPDADYSPAFVEQFKQFHEELKEFFSACSLEEQLEAIAEKADAREVNLIREFVEAKEKAQTPERLATTFELLTMLRGQFHEKLEKNIGSEVQGPQLADIGLEDFSFVLLSRLINHFEASEKGTPWSQALHVLALTVENLRLSGFDAGECRAIESESKAWRQRFEPQDLDHLIRLKATVDRCRRMAEAYCNKILALFPERVERLGRALGVAEHAIKVFSEADIRSHSVFQLSRLVDLLLINIRGLAALPPWDAIVPGKVAGRLVAAPCLNDLPGPFDEAIVALLERVEGDEEIPDEVVGIIVAHETPHLSHLAVRAREAKVVFAVCENTAGYAELQGFLEERLILEVSAENVNVEIWAGSADGGVSDGKRKDRLRQAEVPDVLLSSERRLLSLDEVTLATAGCKANAARRIEELSRFEAAGFAAPPGLVIPFGVMEDSLHAAADLEAEYRALAGRLNELPQKEFVDSLKRLQDIIGKLQVPDEIVSGVVEKFTPKERLMVRSSANCEDLEGLSGAGLYDSVANVSPPEVDRAVHEVWSSLWTGRAATNRKKLGIPHERVYMSVLIQPMLPPEYSFIMHTVNPISHNTDEIYVELAVGLGETLASGQTPGTPYRMACNKHTGDVRMAAFASFSHAIWPDGAGGLIRKAVDYSRIGLSRDEDFRNYLGRRLGSIGRFVEDALGGPQDMEGLVLGDGIYLVQSRPQHGQGVKGGTQGGLFRNDAARLVQI